MNAINAINALEGTSLYIHIPFCARKCTYCDFCSFPGAAGRIDAYIEALTRELRAHRRRLSPDGARVKLRTLYIGGGTPTLLSAAQLERVLRAVDESFARLPGCEATIEANPGTLTREKLDACVRGGINRLSMGMQAFQPGLLALLGRIHDFAQVEAGVRMAREAGVDSISVDLMYALPGQTLRDWRESLDAALALGVSHLSCYELTLEAGTPLHARVQQGTLSLPDEDDCLAMAQCAREMTAQRGMRRYEISNYALPGFESRHNQTYWDCLPYIGAGCAAHGCDGAPFPGVRYENTSDLEAYIAGRNTPLTRTPLTLAQARFERVMLSLRTVRGLDTARFARDFGMDVEQAFGDRMARFIAQGLLTHADGFIACTPRGMDVQNALLVALMD